VAARVHAESDSQSGDWLAPSPLDPDIHHERRAGNRHKSRVASLLGVSRPAVSQYISEKKISGAALVGSGHRAKINVEIARAQLRKNLDVVRHNSLSGKAKVTGPIADIDDLPVEHRGVGVEESIKQQRLRQLELGNGKRVS